jgi:hypothetical protein
MIGAGTVRSITNECIQNDSESIQRELANSISVFKINDKIKYMVMPF